MKHVTVFISYVVNLAMVKAVTVDSTLHLYPQSETDFSSYLQLANQMMTSLTDSDFMLSKYCMRQDGITGTVHMSPHSNVLRDAV